MSSKGIQPFKLESAIPDLETGISLQKDQHIIDRLNTLLNDIKKLS